MVTEYGDTNPQYHSYEPRAKDYSERMSVCFSQTMHFIAFEERDYFVGSYALWNMCDFGETSQDEGGKQGQNQKGLLTIDRNCKKGRILFIQTYWSKNLCQTRQ